VELFAVNFILLQDHSTCFGCCPHPSSGVHKTVTAVSVRGHIIVAATFFQRGQLATLEEGSCNRWKVKIEVNNNLFQVQALE